MIVDINGVEFDLTQDADLVLRKSIPYLISQFVSPVLDGGRSRIGGVRVPQPEYRWSPFYEFSLISGVKKAVEQGDTIVVVGGGLGVSTVVAAQESGPRGEVIAYEGNSKRAQQCQRTVESNNVSDRCEINHAVVATSDTVVGGGSVSRVIPPTQLPECDVLEMDCEGAEEQILRELSQRPRSIVVEYHEDKGVKEDDIQDLLKEYGYRIVSKGAEHRTTGTYVLTATRHAIPD